MIRLNWYRRAVAAMLLLSIALLFAGCFTTKFSLGKVEDAKVDIGYVGNWQYADDAGQKITLIIRNIDNHLYYVEWNDPKDKGPKRFTGYVTVVHGASFAQLKPLMPDGTIAEENAIVRVGMKDASLTIQHLKDEFFKNKTINSSDDLRKIVEANVDTKQMYDDEVIKLTRTPGETDGGL